MRCKQKTQFGKRCLRYAVNRKKYCWQHSKKRTNQKGGDRTCCSCNEIDTCRHMLDLQERKLRSLERALEFKERTRQLREDFGRVEAAVRGQGPSVNLEEEYSILNRSPRLREVYDKLSNLYLSHIDAIEDMNPSQAGEITQLFSEVMEEVKSTNPDLIPGLLKKISIITSKVVQASLFRGR